MHGFKRSFLPELISKLLDEAGQDLVEYTLTFAVVALGSVAGMTAVAQDVNQVFLNVGTLLTTSIT